MAVYPIKMLKDEEGNAFVPLTSSEALKTPDGKTLDEKLQNKLETTNIKAGTDINITVDGNNVTINNASKGVLIDNLTTETPGLGSLDAHQGKVLKEMIPEVVNNVTSTDSDKALSAYQGYLLSGKVVPTGGKEGQVLKKSSDTNWSLEWGDAADPNAIVGDGSIKKIVELTYEEYQALEAIDPDTEYHIYNVEDGTYTYISEGKIQEMIDTAKKTIYPVGSVIYNSNNINPQTYLGYGVWQLTRTFYGGELVGYGSVANKKGENGVVTGNENCTFADTRIASKQYDVVNYVPGVIKGEAGTISIYPKGIVGYVKAHMCISGYAEGTAYGIWFQDNGNALPTGVTMFPTGYKPLYGCFPTVPGYGGAEITYTYHISDSAATDTQFYVNPSFRPYPYSAETKFYPGRGNVGCHLIVEAYAKGGINYMWTRIS